MRTQFKLPRTLLLALLMALTPFALAASGESASIERIVVVGQGSVDLVPDMAVLALTVTREAKTARAALDANSSAMADVIKAMRAKGIAERDLQTSNFSIQPIYALLPRQSSGERPAPQVAGYTVRNILSVRVRDISKVGEVLDESVSLGVNEGGGIVFTNDDPSTALSQARIEAVQDARKKAKTLAEAAGVRAGRILEISEQSYNPGPMPMMRAEMSMAAAARAVPVATGENTYKVAVHMVVAIEQ
jgi:uncharacterized protein YggE